MPPRPLHRWKCLWLGVLVLVVLAWGWGRSRHHLDGFLWMARDFCLSAGQTAGRVEIAWEATDGAWGRDFPWIHEAGASVGEPLFPKAVNWETYPGQLQLTVAHWFLMVACLVPWAAGLAWRVRRHKSNIEHRTPNIER
jgi:hypothetical protein